MRTRFLILAVCLTTICQGAVISITSTQQNPAHRDSRVKYNTERNSQSTVRFTPTPGTARQVSIKKWQVGRVSRKHYEIVNMLWRKTKVISDDKPTTPNAAVPKCNKGKKRQITLTTLQHLTPSSTPSYIEFYYLDDADERMKRRDALIIKRDEKQSKFLTNNANTNDNRYPVLSFTVKEPELGFVASLPHISNKKQLRSKTFYDKDTMYNFIKSKLKTNHIILTKIKPQSSSGQSTKSKSKETSFDDQTCPATFEPPVDNVTLSAHNGNKNVTLLSSTKFYDKIKFFEIYDHHTQVPRDDDDYNMINKDIDGNRKLLEETHKNIGHDDGLNQKHVKKHVAVSFKEHNTIKNGVDASKLQNKTFKHTFGLGNETMFLNLSSKAAFNASRPVLWSNYPFSAVYVYEPSQIHCDAASLSPHWLVAAGACVSRYHQKNPLIQGRSAFVAYCGENWRRPEHVAYVKYVVVHPKYHHKDEKRKYLYNIGLIQVAGSMASACVGWRPISIISHNFAANEDGSQVAAVGWGLDRYNPSYFQNNAYHIPLHVFKSLVFSSSCPGHTGYSIMKQKREEDAIKNIYCLLLPPYNGEDEDPIHGSMLLFGGNLIALYLQEERRPWGAQSALYTGVWKLLPWVLEVAREPEDPQLLGIDI